MQTNAQAELTLPITECDKLHPWGNPCKYYHRHTAYKHNAHLHVQCNIISYANSRKVEPHHILYAPTYHTFSRCGGTVHSALVHHSPYHIPGQQLPRHGALVH